MSLKKNKVLVLFLLVSLNMFSQQENKKLEVLIITGQNNHNWQLTSTTVSQIFNSSQLFNAKIISTPAQGEDMSLFIPDFDGYDLICLDYNGDYWPEQTQQNFIHFIKKGGGLVLFHASDNAFPKWTEFNRIIGVGGWGDRTEKDGPILYWEDGEVRKDYTNGPGGAHGQPIEYLVNGRDLNHPILKGIPVSWLHAKDELYHSLRGPAKKIKVLATAEQDKATGGSGRQEPVLIAVKYGKGRVFHSVLGHVGKNDDNLDAILCEGFITTLLRGAEWAATGKVTQKINDNFPNSQNLKIRETLKK